MAMNGEQRGTAKAEGEKCKHGMLMASLIGQMMRTL